MTGQTLRYTLLRLLLFFACLLLFWLAGLRNPLWLLLAAATVSMLISLFALAGMRDRMSVEVAERVDARREAAQVKRRSERLSDEDLEDLEDDTAEDGYR